MLITLHGQIGDDYGKTHQIKASSIQDALEGLSRQLKMFEGVPLDARPILRVVGHDNLTECPDTIDIVPAIIGGGAVGKIVVGSLLIAASFFPGAQFLLPVGISMVLGGLAQLFIKAPSLSGEKDPDASKYLGLGDNTTKLGTLRPYSMGRVKVTAPHVIAVNIDSNTLVKGEFPA